MIAPEFIIIPLVALLASLLTFFSGFGLGTLLTPAFIIFFPVEISIGLTALVHFLNNIFKISLIGKHTNSNVLFRFGIPAIIGAFGGAWLLSQMAYEGGGITYSLVGLTLQTNLLKILIALLMIIFALFELAPGLKNLQFSRKKLPFGGFLSGFFGGLSGHQGALRSAFLIKFGLTKEAFIATGIGIALFVDITRLSTYFLKFDTDYITENYSLMTLTIASAFAGAMAGKVMLNRVTINAVQTLVGIMILALAALLGTGII